MSDIEQVARAEAERRYHWNTYGTMQTPSLRSGFVDGVSWLAEYLLSDENVEKAARAKTEHRGMVWSQVGGLTRDVFRGEVRASLSAVLGKES